MASGSSKMTVLDSRVLSEDEGCAVDIAYFDPGELLRTRRRKVVLCRPHNREDIYS